MVLLLHIKMYFRIIMGPIELLRVLERLKQRLNRLLLLELEEKLLGLLLGLRLVATKKLIKKLLIIKVGILAKLSIGINILMVANMMKVIMTLWLLVPLWLEVNSVKYAVILKIGAILDIMEHILELHQKIIEKRRIQMIRLLISMKILKIQLMEVLLDLLVGRIKK